MPGRLPRGWLLGCVVSLVGWPVLATESLPPSVRACSTITDRDERLACYDREVASFPAPVAGSQGAEAQAAANRAAAVQAGVATAQTGLPGTNSAVANTKPDATPAAAAPDDAHILAHIVSIDRFPNEMILHLDNGQVWQQIQAVSGDLSLREGDGIKIDRHWGSYWLSGPHVSSMKVVRKS